LQLKPFDTYLNRFKPCLLLELKADRH